VHASPYLRAIGVSAADGAAIRPGRPPALVLGYASLSPQAIAEGVDRLAEAVGGRA